MKRIEPYLLVAAGGAAGSLMRYWAAVQFGARPLTTFGVNVTGSFLIGVLIALAGALDVRWRLLLSTGVLGGFTTFSAWQAEAFLAARDSDHGQVAVILFGSLLCGFAAVYAGYVLGTRLR